MNPVLEEPLKIVGKLGPKKKAIRDELKFSDEALNDGIDVYELRDIFEIFISRFDVFTEETIVEIDSEELEIEIGFSSDNYEGKIRHIQEEMNKIGAELAVDGRFGMNTRGYITDTFSRLSIVTEDGLSDTEYFKLLKAIEEKK